MNSTAIDTSKVVDFGENNSANKLAKSSRKASGKLTTVSATAITKGEIQAETEGLNDRMESSAKTYKRIKSAQKKHLSELRSVGTVLNEYRSMFKSDKLFGQAVAKTPLKVVSRQDRTDLMWLDTNWDSLQELITKGDLTSRSPSGLRQQLAKLRKTESTETPQSETESTDEPSSLDESTTQESSADTPKESPEITETSVASDLVKLLKANPDLDLDVIIDLVRDQVES